MLNAGNVASAYSKLERRVIYIGFNTTDWTPNPELKDVRVRQALNYAVDIQAIINTVMGGYGKKLGSFWRQDFTPYNKELESYAQSMWTKNSETRGSRAFFSSMSAMTCRRWGSIRCIF